MLDTAPQDSEDCWVITHRADSDHHTVRMELNLISIIYKEKVTLNRGDIDWRRYSRDLGKACWCNEICTNIHNT